MEVENVSSEAGHFGEPASAEALERVAARLRERTIEVSVVSDAAQARDLVLQRLQLGPYASGSGKVILVVGSQKIVPNLDAALARIREYVLPWEDAQVRPVVPTGSFVGKILMIEREWIAGRIEVVLVRQPVGM
jgi:hypothetical protein